MGRRDWEKVYIAVLVSSCIGMFVLPWLASIFYLGLFLIFLFGWRSRRRRRRLYRALRRTYVPPEVGSNALNIRYRRVNGEASNDGDVSSELIGVLMPIGDRLEVRLISEFDGSESAISLYADRDVIDARSLSRKHGGTGWLKVSEPGICEHQFACELDGNGRRKRDNTRKLGDLLQAHLHIDRCLQCDYELVGNATGVCPECGTPFFRPNDRPVPSGEFDSEDL